MSFSDNGEVSGEVVFAGYGIVVPDSQDFGYDSYATLDVKDKVVVVLRYFPEDADQKTKGILARYSDLRYKAMAARQRGAKALLVVTGPRSPNAGQTVPMTFDTALAGSGIVAASINGSAADAIFASTGKSLEDAQRSFDSGNPHAAGFAIPSITVTISASVVREKRTGYNIAGYLPSAPAAGVAQAKPWIALGAHYDHLGRGENGSSLAGSDERGRVHYGADDNASGIGGGARDRRDVRRADDAPPERAARVLVGRGVGPDRIVRVRQRAAGPARADRRVLQFRHGRPDAGQQADRAGRRHQPGVGDG